AFQACRIEQESTCKGANCDDISVETGWATENVVLGSNEDFDMRAWRSCCGGGTDRPDPGGRGSSFFAGTDAAAAGACAHGVSDPKPSRARVRSGEGTTGRG